MSEVKTNKLTGTTSAGDIDVTSEGGAVTMKLHSGICKAYYFVDVNPGGTPGIEGSLNISSITDDGTGRFDGNINSNMNNDDFVQLLGQTINSASSTAHMAMMHSATTGRNKSTSKFAEHMGVREDGAVFEDPHKIESVIFGELA